MNDPVYQRLREIVWRRKLTKAELDEWRKVHPEDATDAELETALSGAMDKLPDAPVPSNFTARILQEIDRQEIRPATHRKGWIWVWRVLMPRAAVAALVVGTGFFAVHRHHARQMDAIRQSLVDVASVPAFPSPEALEDFNAIQKLSSGPVADKELIALMQ